MLSTVACGGAPTEYDDATDALAGGRAMQRRTVRDPLAMCNDGSPAVYYVRAGVGASRDRWVIHLKGGGSCSSWQECNTRRRDLVSSQPWGATLRKSGVLDPHAVDNPHFFDYTHVFVPYCSSDLWTGDTARVCDAATDPTCPTDPTQRWHDGETMQIRGKRIVDAVIDDLRNPPGSGPDLDDAINVLFSGSSAGASGMRNNIDRVADTLRTTNPQVRIRGLNDSAFSTSALATITGPTSCTIQLRTRSRAYAFWGAPELDSSCRAAATAAGHHPSMCLVLPYLLGCNPAQQGHIETPFFVYMDQTDQLTMGNQGLDPNDRADRATFRRAHRQLFAWASYQTSIDWAPQGVDGIGLFSTDTQKHTGAVSGTVFMGVTSRFVVGGQTYSEVLSNWLRRDTPSTCVAGTNLSPGSPCR